MNILVFSWRDPKHPLAGGAEQVMHEHTKGWIKAGYKVTLFSSKVKGLIVNENIEGVEVVRRGYQYLGVQIAGFFYYLRNKSKYNFIVDQFHGVPFFTPLYVNKPIMAVIQEPARSVWFKNPLPFPVNLIIGFLGYIFEPFFFLFYKKVQFMTGSNSAKVDVINFGIPSKNITVISHGVNIPRAKLSISLKRKAITFLGILSKDKGIEDALKCFAILNKLDKYDFWVIGKADTINYHNKLQKLVTKLELENNIKFWGRVSDDKKFELLSKSYVLVNPSVHEGWGLVNIEANTVGTPVIAYPSQGLIDSVKNGVSGVLTKNSTPEALSEEIKKMITDNTKYEKLSSGAKKWASGFSWQKSSNLSIKLIKKICE